MSALPTFEDALRGMQTQLEQLPAMAPPMDIPDEERVRRAMQVFLAHGSAQYATYLDSCIHCGHCADACHFYISNPDPKYTPIHKLDLFNKVYHRELGPFRWIYRLFKGPLTAQELEEWQELVFDSCTMCGRCSMICPMGIDIASMVKVGRGALNAAGLTPPAIAAIAGEQAQRDTFFGADADKLRETIGMLEEAEGMEIPLDKERAELMVLVAGMDIVMNPRGLLATAKVLNHIGVDWTVRSDGYEAINFGAQVGDEELQAELARKRIAAAERCGAKTVILCECGHTYPALRWAANLQEKPLPFEVMYISEYMGRQVEAGRLKLTGEARAVAFHDPCKTGRVGGVFEEPRTVLRAMNAEVRETPDNKVTNFCCGGGGAIFLLNRAMPLRAGAYRIKADQFRATGAGAVVTACGSCRLNFLLCCEILHLEKPVIQSLVELAADNLAEDAPAGQESWRRPGPHSG